jgi:hypothetical protein
MEEFIIKIEASYLAEFNPDTGEVLSVGPKSALQERKHTIEIDNETAEDIIQGNIRIQSCFIDLREKTIEVSEVKQVHKLDDVVHRIISKKWSNIEKPDIYISNKNDSLVFYLTEEYGGTYIQDDKFQPVKKRKILWDGDTDLNFLVTDYNDPNILYKMITIKLNDLVGKEKIIDIRDVPENYSIYTRRIFKDYVIE